MFCRNCGSQYVVDEAVMCVKCGAQKGQGMNFCPGCGQQTPPGAVICHQCGVDCTKYGIKGEKSKIAAGLLGIFLGCYGAHNFYLGKTKRAVAQLALFIGGLILYFVGVVAGTVLAATELVAAGIILIILGVLGILAALAVGIWALVEGIMILCGKIKTDGAGRPLKD